MSSESTSSRSLVHGGSTAQRWLAVAIAFGLLGSSCAKKLEETASVSTTETKYSCASQPRCGSQVIACNAPAASTDANAFSANVTFNRSRQKEVAGYKIYFSKSADFCPGADVSCVNVAQPGSGANVNRVIAGLPAEKHYFRVVPYSNAPVSASQGFGPCDGGPSEVFSVSP